MNTEIDFDELMNDANSVVLIVEKGNGHRIVYSPNLTEQELLDILSEVTSLFYEVAEGEEPPSLH